ncbi:hypothetical protein J2T56_003149 [Natronobacillus azotifigens]|uniref:Alpha-galactosidase n=1 Tax=Natronobacillus azotifigens TaxID=472978 RepID=A0A9J6RFM8_9BACI|nr:glycoside hydrolase family 27 protein [Natronobacillus azotifigens]MCZ0704570.1 glycoside hydrolase family 27 protein [Natronobacillus azotifigens]
MKHHQYALTPPMGWNSWDCYGATVTEEEVKNNADYMAKHLKDYGWEYVVVDIQWSESGAVSSQYRPFIPLEMDEYSRLIPATNRFPSAENNQGFKPLADYVHSLGLKFGIHIMRGIPRQAVHQNTKIKGTEAGARDIAQPNSICPWNTDMYGVNPYHEASQKYYDSLFELYASWDVDFVKVDDIADSKLYHKGHMDEVKMIRKAIDNSGRDMVLSLSPGPAHLNDAAVLEENANMWRMTDDFWDLWELLKDMFERCYRWSKNVGPGHWPDADMLPLGHIGIRSVDGGASDRMTRFTKDEQITMMSLWSIFRSPLMFGGELNDNDEFTLSLLTNEDLLHVHRHGQGARQVYRENDEVVWHSYTNDHDEYVALFNLSDEERTVSVSLEQLGLDKSSLSTMVDVFTKEQVSVNGDKIEKTLRPHACQLIRIKQ